MNQDEYNWDQMRQQLIGYGHTPESADQLIGRLKLQNIVQQEAPQQPMAQSAPDSGGYPISQDRAKNTSWLDMLDTTATIGFGLWGAKAGYDTLKSIGKKVAEKYGKGKGAGGAANFLALLANPVIQANKAGMTGDPLKKQDKTWY